MATTTGDISGNTDRTEALREFDATKTGVKGLVDSGITAVPAIFRLPPANRHPQLPISNLLSIPTVDFSLPRSTLIGLIAEASSQWGFFQAINHGIPAATIHRTISAVRSFNNLPADVRSQHYSRGMPGGVNYSSNLDLYRSAAASWRDTLQISFAPQPPELQRIPEVCRTDLPEWDGHVAAFGSVVMGLMSEGLGVSAGMLEGMGCGGRRMMAAQYYPPCPEPEKTIGTADHTDPSVLTVLVQDDVGGLQVKAKEDGHDVWVNVEPIPSAIVVNVGDLLEIISNDVYKSVEHRVVANAHEEARVSIAVFLNPGKQEDILYGPLPELVSPEKPPLYRSFTIQEFLKAFFSKELSSKSLLEHFKVETDHPVQH